MAATEDLYSLMVPLNGEWLVVPRSTVAEVIRYALRTVDEGPEDWLIGTAAWNNLEIPVVSYENLIGGSAPDRGGRSRIVVVRPVSGSSTGPYGVLAEGFPQMVRVSPEVMETDVSYRAPENGSVICRVQMLHEQALIPDLDTIEQRLADLAAV